MCGAPVESTQSAGHGAIGLRQLLLAVVVSKSQSVDKCASVMSPIVSCAGHLQLCVGFLTL